MFLLERLPFAEHSVSLNVWGALAGGPVVRNPPCNARDTGSIPDPGRSPTPTEQLSLCATLSRHSRALELQPLRPLCLEPVSAARGSTAARSPHAAARSSPCSGAAARSLSSSEDPLQPLPQNNNHNKTGGNPSILPGPRAFEIAVNVL